MESVEALLAESDNQSKERESELGQTIITTSAIQCLICMVGTHTS